MKHKDRTEEINHNIAAANELIEYTGQFDLQSDAIQIATAHALIAIAASLEGIRYELQIIAGAQKTWGR